LTNCIEEKANTIEKQDTFIDAFIFLGTEEYNYDIFLGTGTKE
jgi:hypothetical protein